MYSFIDDFQVEEIGNNCLYSALHNVLSYQGLKITEAEAFFAFGGLDLKYHPKEKYFGIADLLKRIEGHSLTPWVCVDLGKLKEAKEIVPDFFNRLNQKKPIVCIIQVGKLSYLDTPAEMKSPRRHTCVLYGMDVMKDKAYIADAYRVDRLGNITVFMGEIPLSELLSALCGYLTMDMDYQANTDTFTIQSAFTDAVKSFLNPVVTKDYVTGNQAFLEYIKHLKSYEEDKKRYQEGCFEAGYLIKVTSIHPYLTYFSEILPGLLEWEESSLSKLQKDLEEVKTLWDDFRVKLIRDGFRDKEKRNKGLLSTSETIMERQKEIFKEILKYMETASNTVSRAESMVNK